MLVEWNDKKYKLSTITFFFSNSAKYISACWYTLFHVSQLISIKKLNNFKF